MTEAGERLLRLPFGHGAVVIGADGAVAAVQHPDGRPLLLQEKSSGIDSHLHTPAHRWGKGFVVADGRGYRFDTPMHLAWRADGVRASYACGPLTLTVDRQVGDGGWAETYELANPSTAAVRVGSLAISTPWRDVYESSHDSLTRAVHAHVWTGGAEAWVWVVPMDGAGPGLGLRLTEGELWAYSVESRNHVTSSNVRGHLYLHLTDHARAPGTFGGQPELTLAAGERYRLAWDLAWHPSLEAFHRHRRPLVTAPRVTVETGEAVVLHLAPGVTCDADLPVLGVRPGLAYLNLTTMDGRKARVAYLVNPPLRQLAERRAEFLLDRQRPLERADSSRFAFVPYDNDAQLTMLGGGWNDWSDGRERVGSALLLQLLLRLGWGDRAALADAVDRYHRFVTDHLVAHDGSVWDDHSHQPSVRLYNFPWFARFLLDAGNLDFAHRVMTRFYALGGGNFLAFELGTVVTDLTAQLRDAGRPAEADHLAARLLEQAQTFLSYGTRLPAHEVNYEQSMVAPLLDLLLAARRLHPDRVPAQELRRRLRWLTAFAADQPDPRLRHMPIRHWDGYWFGRLRLWGDVFPHYWSILNAAVYLAWPDDIVPADELGRLREQARAVLHGNLFAFGADGSASCAFVYPSCVDGRPAHVADPLANDQDWALVYALRHLT